MRHEGDNVHLQTYMAPRAKKYIDLSKDKPEDYEIIRHIGSGNFSDLFQIQYTGYETEQEYYALKRVSKRDIRRLHKENEALMEKHCLFKLQAPSPLEVEYDARDNIAKLYYTLQDKDYLYFIMDYYSELYKRVDQIFHKGYPGDMLRFNGRGGDLWDMTYGLGFVDSNVARYFIGQLVNAVEWCHNRQIVHRDLKAENLLLSKDGTLKLIDFGTALDLCHPELKSSGNTTRGRKNIRFEHFVGTAQFMPPETLKNKNTGTLIDLWALGCTFYQLLVGTPPFQAPSDFLVHLRSKNVDLDFPPDFDPLAEDLIRSLIVVVPEHRLASHDVSPFSLLSVKHHPYFDGVDFEHLDHLILHRPPQQPLYASCLHHMAKNWDRFCAKWIQSGWLASEDTISEISTTNETITENMLDESDKAWNAPMRPVNLEMYSQQLLKMASQTYQRSFLRKHKLRVMYLKRMEKKREGMDWNELVNTFLAENHGSKDEQASSLATMVHDVNQT